MATTDQEPALCLNAVWALNEMEALWHFGGLLLGILLVVSGCLGLYDLGFGFVPNSFSMLTVNGLLSLGIEGGWKLFGSTRVLVQAVLEFNRFQDLGE